MKGSTPLAPAGGRSRAFSDFLALTKPRVNLLVLVTTVIGFQLAGAGQHDLALLVHTAVGTLFVASGAAVLNQVLERDVDARMRRTERRPIPLGRVSPAEARVLGLALAAVGLVQLWLGANALAAFVALVTVAGYALVYTPLKPVTSLATVIGAVPGALPPVIGWAAATGSLSLEAWALFGIVFFWQMPHVLALSWMYREDYERGGIRVLPVVHPEGRSTGLQAINYTAALIPVTLLPAALGISGRWYAGAAVVLGLGLLVLAVQFARARTRQRARALFYGTLAYLPALWVVMLADRH